MGMPEKMQRSLKAQSQTAQANREAGIYEMNPVERERARKKRSAQNGDQADPSAGETPAGDAESASRKSTK